MSKIKPYSVLTEPHPLLRQVAHYVLPHDFGAELDEIVARMTSTMQAENGIGLAANQVGILKRIVVVDFAPYVLINPEILGRSPTKISVEEGCLSVPGKLVRVPRAALIQICYRDLAQNMHIIELSEIEAICLQHEINHLDGILISDLLEKKKGAANDDAK